MFTKPVVFVAISILSILVIASFYSSSSTFLVFGKKTVIDIECYPQDGKTRCCGSEYDDENPLSYGITSATYCTTCDNTTPPSNCTPREKITMQSLTTPPSPPPGPKGPLGDILQGGGVLPELQQTLPSPTTPPIGGISEQPPLFGRNVGNAPLGGFFGQQPTTATTMVVPPTPILTPEPTPDLPTTPDQPVPMFGLAQQPTAPTLTPPPLFPQGGFEVMQEPEAPPMFGQVQPLTDGVQDQPPVQEPEEQTTEEDGQVIAKDEDEDDNDGPVPPECPTTGPIPPDCTLKPKFPERAIE